MCPCFAPAVGFLPELLLIVVVILCVLAMSFWRALPYLGVALLAMLIAVWRWCSGAVLVKAPYQRDDDYWDTAVRRGQRGPRFTRAVRAAGRLSLAGVGIGLLVSPLLTAIVVGTLSVLVSGAAAYTRRARIIGTARQLTGRAGEMVRR